MKFYLVHSGSQELEITGECQIGRRSGDLKFGDELLSGTHAKFITDGEKLYVTDLGSSNGTFVNKKKIEELVPFEVTDGDLIEMGGQKMSVKCLNPEATRIEDSVAASPGESTRIEDSIALSQEHSEEKSEGTNVEAVLPSLSVAREEAPAPVEAAVALEVSEVAAVEVATVPAAGAVAVEAEAVEIPAVEEPEAPAASIAIEAEAPRNESTIVEPAASDAVEIPAIAAVGVETKSSHFEQNEGTHAEAASPALVVSETTQDDIVAPSEATHVEIAEKHDSTHIEVPAMSVERTQAEAASHLKIVEPVAANSAENQGNFVRPAVIHREEAVRISPSGNITLEDLEEAPAKPKNALVAVAHDMHALFGPKTLVIASAVIIGVFAFLLTGKKRVNRAVASPEVFQAEAPVAVETAQSSIAAPAPTSRAVAAPDANNPAPANTLASLPAVTETAAPQDPTSEVNAADAANAAKEEEAARLAQEQEEEKMRKANEVIKKARAEAKKKKAAAKKVAAKKTSKATPSAEVSLKSTKKDPYAEAYLLKQLSKIREEAKRSSSQRVKAALAVDAAEMTAAHYKKFKNAILIKWKNGRTIASTKEKARLKKTLQGQLVALNNREKAVKSKVSSYINGKIKSPL